MFSLPFLLSHHAYPLPTFYQEGLAIALGLLAVGAILLAHPRAGLVIPHSALWLLAFAAVLGLQVELELVAYYEQAVMGGLYVLWAAMLLWLGSELRRSLSLERICEVLAFALLLAGMLNAVFGLLQYFIDARDLPKAISCATPVAGRTCDQPFTDRLCHVVGTHPGRARGSERRTGHAAKTWRDS